MNPRTMATAWRALACAAALSVAGGSAQATLCTFTNAGDQCLINWDASALGTGPFDADFFNLSGTGLPPLTWSWYDDLDATGSLVASGGPGSALALAGTLPAPSDAIWDDGLASALLTLTVDSVASISNFALKFTDSSGAQRVVAGTPGALTVPTPGSLSLLAVALLGAGAATSRRLRPHLCRPPESQGARGATS